MKLFAAALAAAIASPIAGGLGYISHSSAAPTLARGLEASGLAVAEPSVDYWYVKGKQFAPAAEVILGLTPKPKGGHFLRQTCISRYDVEPPQGKVLINVCRFTKTTQAQIIKELKEESGGSPESA